METNCPGGPVEHLVGRLRVAATKLGRSDEWENLRDDLHHAAAEIERLRAELSDAYAEVHKQVAVSKVIFDRALVNRAKASLATPSEESKCKKY